MSRSTATLIGFGAILIWSLLAVLTAATGPVPPFQLVAMTFGIGGVLGLAVSAARGRLRQVVPPWQVLALGCLGPFGDTTAFFAAVKLAPPAEANLVHYLWPLLIVLFSALLPGGRLKPRHVVGALIGLAATGLILAGRFRPEVFQASDARMWLGFTFAFVGAFAWAAYSVLSRRLAEVPTETVTAVCLMSAALAFLVHLGFETTIWPSRTSEWVGVIGLGLGPVGAAFFLWDVGMKRGDVSFLGVASYAAPVLSTLILVLADYAPASWTLAGACLLIVIGALVASGGRAPREQPPA
jgi:drug/metabolite transporter (DMT)-like permease